MPGVDYGWWPSPMAWPPPALSYAQQLFDLYHKNNALQF